MFSLNDKSPHYLDGREVSRRELGLDNRNADSDAAAKGAMGRADASLVSGWRGSCLVRCLTMMAAHLNADMVLVRGPFLFIHQYFYFYRRLINYSELT